MFPPANRQVLTGRQFFPHLISAPFHQGLTVVFAVAAGLAVLAALASCCAAAATSTPKPRPSHRNLGPALQ